jgi:hypothetical protein
MVLGGTHMGTRKTESNTVSRTLNLCCLLLSIVTVSCNHQLQARLGGAQAEDYWVLGEGSSYIYKVSVGTQEGTLISTNLIKRKLHGKEVTPIKIEVQVGGQSHVLFQYVVEDENGIYTFAKQETGDLEPKLEESQDYDIRKPLKVGNAWNLKLKLIDHHVVPARAEILAIDDVVDVPAGTFQKCIKVRTFGTGTPTQNGLITDTHKVDRYSWYAPSVGLVKFVGKENQGVTYSYQLESFKNK